MAKGRAAVPDGHRWQVLATAFARMARDPLAQVFRLVVEPSYVPERRLGANSTRG